jgi:hypothetical protein
MTLELALRSLEDPRLSVELPMLLLSIARGVVGRVPSDSSPRKDEAVVPMAI